MSEEKALVPVEQKLVEFYGDELTAVLLEDGVVYILLRPICDYLGVSWAGQRERINRDPVLSEVIRFVRVTRTNSAGGNPNVLALPLDYLNGFLFGINASRVKPEISKRLITYQRECYRVLADAFLSPVTAVSPTDASDEVLMQLHNMALVIAATTKEMLEARRLAMDSHQRLDRAREYLQGMNKRIGGIDERVTAVEQQIRTGKLTHEQAVEIKKRVNLIAQEMAKHEPAKSHYQAVYVALGEEAGVTSYQDIPPKSFEAAAAFLDNWLKTLRESGQGHG